MRSRGLWGRSSSGSWAQMLKQRHQRERATRSWEDSIANGREEMVDILDQSPSLRRTLPAWMARM